MSGLTAAIGWGSVLCLYEKDGIGWYWSYSSFTRVRGVSVPESSAPKCRRRYRLSGVRENPGSASGAGARCKNWTMYRPNVSGKMFYRNRPISTSPRGRSFLFRPDATQHQQLGHPGVASFSALPNSLSLSFHLLYQTYPFLFIRGHPGQAAASYAYRIPFSSCPLFFPPET